MDAKITKERLSRMLSYDWLKIVGLIVAAIVFWTLVFTMTATRITPAQQFTAINYFGNVGTVNTKFSTTLGNALSKGVFSYEVIEVTEVDVGGNAEYGTTLMEARVATYEGDVVFAPNITATDYGYEWNGETVYETYMQRLVRGYGYYLENLDMENPESFFKRLESYLNRYYGDYQTGTINVETVRADFLARVAKNKDKRFKTNEQKEQGVKDDIARIEKYCAALKEFYGYLNSGVVRFEETVTYDYENGGAELQKGIYSINLCPDREKMPKLKDIVGYIETIESETGEKQELLCADNMHVALFRFKEVEESFEYESLLYINYVIRASLA